MDFDFLFRTRPAKQPPPEFLQVGDRRVPLHFARHRRARRYLLRLLPDASARVIVPRGGSLAEATAFARANTDWLHGQLLRLLANPARIQTWHTGTKILFRGESVALEVVTVNGADWVAFADRRFSVIAQGADLRPEVERHLWELAGQELPTRTQELALEHGFVVKRVSVRNQRTRWGSCSRRGTVSLNWRLIQTPVLVRDYIILHELAHLRHMNHSAEFWNEVARLCPEFSSAERWIKQHSSLLR